MWLRGVSLNEVQDAILKGNKVEQKSTGLVENFYRFFSVVYDEKIFKETKIRKVYPVTVKLW